MARAKAAESPRGRNKAAAADEFSRAIEKLRDLSAQIDDLSREGFPYREAVRARTELSLRETIRRIFGEKSPEYQAHKGHKLRTSTKAEAAQSTGLLKELITKLELQKADQSDTKSPSAPAVPLPERVTLSVVPNNQPISAVPASAIAFVPPVPLTVPDALGTARSNQPQPVVPAIATTAPCATGSAADTTTNSSREDRPSDPDAASGTINHAVQAEKNSPLDKPTLGQPPADNPPIPPAVSLGTNKPSVPPPATMVEPSDRTAPGAKVEAIAVVQPLIPEQPSTSDHSQILPATPIEAPSNLLSSTGLARSVPEEPSNCSNHTGDLQAQGALPAGPSAAPGEAASLPASDRTDPAIAIPQFDGPSETKPAVAPVSTRTTPPTESASTLPMPTSPVTDDESHHVLRRLCARFHLVARQLRLRNEYRPTLEIEDEQDLQDLFYALLRLQFDEVGVEEWTPPYAKGIRRSCYLLDRERTLVVVKKTRSGLNARDFGEQLKSDQAHFGGRGDGRTLFCFIYDPDGRVGNPRGLEADLMSVSDSLSVEVIVAPK
jgi:hypothetical protein